MGAGQYFLGYLNKMSGFCYNTGTLKLRKGQHMSEQPPRRISPFEAIRRQDEQGEDYWLARELMALLGYPRWSDAKPAIERAMDDCERSGRSVADNFRNIPENSGRRGRPKDTFRLTRYACRLVVMAARAGSRDDVIAAHARTYFSDQVEAAEKMDAQLFAIEELIQQARERVETRDRLSASYDQLEAIAHAMGMKRKPEFARLHNEGDIGMFTMSKEALAERHGVEPQHGRKRVNMNDHLATPIMGGIIVRNTIAGADISQMQSPTNQDMWDANYSAGREIRELLTKHGIKPEDVPPEPHISEARRIAEGQIPLNMIPPESLPEPSDDSNYD
jgi:DNA-damage-inducible protein D